LPPVIAKDLPWRAFAMDWHGSRCSGGEERCREAGKENVRYDFKPIKISDIRAQTPTGTRSATEMRKAWNTNND
jgi:hypothetical protein